MRKNILNSDLVLDYNHHAEEFILFRNGNVHGRKYPAKDSSRRAYDLASGLVRQSETGEFSGRLIIKSDALERLANYATSNSKRTIQEVELDYRK